LRIDVRQVRTWLPVAGILFSLLGVAFAAGYGLRPSDGLMPGSLMGKWQQDLEVQRASLDKTRSDAEENAHALARRMALLNAYVMRLDAVGQRMTQIAHLDPGEFDFGHPPPVGGPQSAMAQAPTELGDVIDSLDALDKRLSDREREMKVLEDILVSTRLQKEVRPSGWPIAAGYITSPYGARTDPFTGLRDFHPGVDFASAEGTSVLAVAAGIVTRTGEQDGYDGYGELVEINHGNGYSTRYGHNARILVKVGDRVARGQTIAHIGSTGRSTGPHVHFEVLLNGQTVDPEQYIQAVR